MNLMRIKPSNVQFDFLLNSSGGVYESEILERGGRIYHFPNRNNIRIVAERYKILPLPNVLDAILKKESYDVVHRHGAEYCGLLLKTAAKHHVPVRVAHCHNMMWNLPPDCLQARIRMIYHRHIDQKRILKYATDIIACSQDSGRSFLASEWEKDQRCRTLFCGVSLEGFYRALKTTRSEMRRRLGISDSAKVIGHIGNQNFMKNHEMLLRVFRELAHRHEDYYLMMIGAECHKPTVLDFIKENRLEERVILAGERNDVPELLIHCCDAYLFPSIAEGLPVSCLEANAAGLYIVCSDVITDNYLRCFKNHVETVSLNQDVSHWADRVELAFDKRIAPEEGITMLEASPFSIEASLTSLLNMYYSRL